MRNLRRYLLKNIDALSAQLRRKPRNSGHILTRVRQALNNSLIQCISNACENDRQLSCRFPNNLNCGSTRCDNEVHISSDKIRYQAAKLLYAAFRRSIFDFEILPLNVAKISKASSQVRQERALSVSEGRKNANDGTFGTFLGQYRSGPNYSGRSSKGYEIPPSHRCPGDRPIVSD